MACSCQGADPEGDFDEFDCLADVGEYTLAVHEGWRGSKCYGDGGHVCGCDDEDYCLPYDACCVEHEFDATGEVVSTTCHYDRGGAHEGGRPPWEAATMSKLCTQGHSDAGAVAPAYRDCSQEALDAGRCGTGDWDTCAECVDDNIPTGTFFANVGYTSCPNSVVDAISENIADGGTCSHAWTKRKYVYRETWPTPCSFQLWKDLTTTDHWEYRPWLTIMGVFTALFLVGLPFLLSFLALPTLAERAGRRLVSVWRPTFGWILWNFVSAGYLAFNYRQNQSEEYYLLPREDFGPRILLGYLMVIGYATAVVTEERIKVGAYCSLVICLTIHHSFGIAFVVLGCAAVAFAPRRGEREKVRSAVFTTKASAAAGRGRLPRWACLVYFIATWTFIDLAYNGEFSTDPSSCSPCNCKDDTLIDCYEDARTLELRLSSLNGIELYLPWKLDLARTHIEAIEPGAFWDMARLEKLQLDKNKISIIEPYTFAGLNKLEELRLAKNKIQVMKSSAFRGLHNLERLRLEKNDINSIESESFAGLHNLQSLRLEKNNINRIESESFAGLHNLQSLRLEWNQINRIEHMAFVELDSLRSLDLSWNQINTIENGTFAGLDSLRKVTLQGNPVTCADAHAAGLPRSVECEGF
jgi:hypothetical protein